MTLRRVLITGAGGQLGRALAETFADERVQPLTRAEWDVSESAPAGLERPDLVLHAAAWTDVDGAEADPQGAAAVNVGGTANVAALGAPLVAYSSDTRSGTDGGVRLREPTRLWGMANRNRASRPRPRNPGFRSRPLRTCG